MSTTRGLPVVDDPIWREGDSPSASRLGMMDKLTRNVTGAGSTRVMYRNGQIIIGNTPLKSEWSVVISGTTATIYHRPVVFASRRIPAAWATDEDSDYTASTYYTLYPALTVDLLDGSDVGKGSGFVAVEIDLDQDTLTGIHSVTRPIDDPAQSIVRWPLVHIVQSEPVVGGVTVYRFRVDAVLHTGQIKIPALFAP